MAYKNIRLTDECYIKLDKNFKKFGFKTKIDCIENMIDFFIINSILPDSTINLDLQNSISKINTDFIKRDDSFRKWFGHLNNKKISLIIKQQEDILKQNEELKNVLLNNVALNIATEIKEENNLLLTNNVKQNNDSVLTDDMLSKFEKVIESKEKIINDLQTKLNILTSKAKEEKTTFGKQKFVIELSAVEFENLKK